METLSAPSPFSFVLFGASGNLAQLKIYPALYTLALKKRLPAQYAIVGYARTEMSDDAFRTLVGDSVKRDHGEVNEGLLTEFLSHVFYHQGQYTEKSDFEKLAKRLADIEKNFTGETVRLAYLSIPPTVFSDVLTNLCEGGVHDKRHPFRCIVEKPVGHDLKSFEIIQQKLQSCFNDEEIYLLDHYLGKEAVRNIFYLRFANPFLERVLKNTLIQHVQITATEEGGIEGRAGYFDQAGTFRDFFQSHLLMMMSLLTMRLREEDSAIIEGRYDALQQIYLPPASDLSEIVIAGQYTAGHAGDKNALGYLQEEGVAAGSRTNTYAALKLMSRTSRWQGVPFYLRSGKRLKRKETKVAIQFQVPRGIGHGSTPNRLEIILQGEAGMRLHLQTKMGGIVPQWRPLVMVDPLVCVGDCLPEHGLLLLEAIHGYKQWFLSFDEVRTAWRLIDPLQSYLDAPGTPLHTYVAGSDGPTEADAWMGREGVAWF